MSRLTDNDVYEIGFQDDVDSFPLRETFANIKAAHNDLETTVANITTAASGNEVVDARDYAATLQDRLQYASREQGNFVISGLIVTEQAVPDMTVQVSAGQAIVNGVLTVKMAVSNSSTVTAPVNKRFDVVVMNSDNTLSIVVGNDSNDRVLPAIASSQRPLAILDLDSATVSLNNGAEIIDSSVMGCYADGVWYWKIQQAIDSFDDRTNAVEQGFVYIKKGDYYEEVDLSGKSNVTLIFENGAKVYRISNTARAIKSINTVGNETVGIKIICADLYGNSKSGAFELMKFEYTDELSLLNCRCDGNSSASATYKNILINQCDRIIKRDLFLDDGSGNIDFSTMGLTNVTAYSHGGLTYDTGWINRSDWTDVHMGSNTTKDVDSNVNHGFGCNLSELEVHVLVSTDGTDANSFEVTNSNSYDEDEDSLGVFSFYNVGLTIYQIDVDNIQVQTGYDGLLYQTGGAGPDLISTQDWYYKIVVYSKK
jgi:hypothetical protein